MAKNQTPIYSEDGDITRLAERLDLKAYKIDDLPIPDAARQGQLDLVSEEEVAEQLG